MFFASNYASICVLEEHNTRHIVHKKFSPHGCLAVERGTLAGFTSIALYFASNYSSFRVFNNPYATVVEVILNASHGQVSTLCRFG